MSQYPRHASLSVRFLIAILALCTLAAIPANAAKPTTVVLIPGAGSSGARIWAGEAGSLVTKLIGGDAYFGKFSEELSKNSIPNFVCPQSEDADSRTIEERAEDCAKNILAYNNGEIDSRNIILLGHSMGGLIARLLAQRDDIKNSIHSVVTISTPHKGTPLADFTIERDQDDFNFYALLLNLMGFTKKSRNYLPELRTDRNAEEKNIFLAQDILDNPEVRYFSFSTSVEQHSVLALQIFGNIMEDEMKKRGLDQTSFGKKNDGIVPEYSMIHGEFLGHIEANHWASACIDPVKDTEECQLTLNFVMPFLKKLSAF